MKFLTGRINGGNAVHLIKSDSTERSDEVLNPMVYCRGGGNVRPVKTIQFTGADLSKVNCKNCLKFKGILEG